MHGFTIMYIASLSRAHGWLTCYPRKLSSRSIKSRSFYELYTRCSLSTAKAIVQEIFFPLDILPARWHYYCDCWSFLLTSLLFLLLRRMHVWCKSGSRRVSLHLWCMLKNFARINVWTIWQFYGAAKNSVEFTLDKRCIFYRMSSYGGRLLL